MAIQRLETLVAGLVFSNNRGESFTIDDDDDDDEDYKTRELL